jgi:hypothetical protein
MSILNNIYKKYTFACKEYFTLEEERPSISATNVIEWKNNISHMLCEIQVFLDSSIGFNQMTDVPFDAQDSKYPMNKNEVSINGSIDGTQRTVFNEIEIDREMGTFCEITKWTPDFIEDKDSIIVYITALVNEYNKEILVLEGDKVKLSAYIQKFNRFLKQYLNNELVPQCDILSGPDRDTLCNSNCDSLTGTELILCCDNLTNETDRRNCCMKISDLDERKKCEDSIDGKSIRIKAVKEVKLLINDKRDLLNVKMCNYIKKYKKIEDIRYAIIHYIDKLNNIWSTNDITKTRVRLNYAGNKMVVEGSNNYSEGH